MDERQYDELSVEEQAARRAKWDAEIRDRLEHLDLASEFRETGLTYVGLDAHGRVVRYSPEGSELEVLHTPD